MSLTMTPQVREEVWPRIDALCRKFEQRKLLLLALFSVIYFAAAFLITIRRTLWNDELFTLYIARLPHFSDVWRALATGAEQTPPLFYIITRVSFAAFGVNNISIRLPEVLAFWGMCLCLYCFVSKRSSTLCGLIAMLFPLATGALYYVTEGRPYALVLGFSAFGLLCWQWATEGRNRRLTVAGIGVSLATAVSCHYYGVLILFPLALGEFVRSARRRQIDWAIWAALALSLTPLIVFLPLIESARAYAPHFWGKPTWLLMFLIYHHFLLEPATILLMALLALVMAYAALRPYFEETSVGAKPLAVPVHEIAAAFGFILLPVIGTIVAKMAVGAFADRYVLPAVIGLSIAVAWGLYCALDGRAFMLCAVGCILLAFVVGKEAKKYLSAVETQTSRASAYAFIEAHAKLPGPIVIANAITFLELSYHPPQDLADRLLYLSNVKLALQDTGTNDPEEGLIHMKDWAGLNVQPLDDFVPPKRTFLVYAAYPDDYQWLIPELTQMHLKINLLAWADDKRLLFVSHDDERETFLKVK